MSTEHRGQLDFLQAWEMKGSSVSCCCNGNGVLNQLTNKAVFMWEEEGGWTGGPARGERRCQGNHIKEHDFRS